MVDGYYRKTVKLLSRYGFVYVGNAKGSHEKWVHPEIGRVAIVSRRPPRHTANAILKKAGIPERV